MFVNAVDSIVVDSNLDVTLRAGGGGAARGNHGRGHVHAGAYQSRVTLALMAAPACCSLPLPEWTASAPAFQIVVWVGSTLFA